MDPDKNTELKRDDLDDVGKRNTNKNSYRYRKFDGKRTTLDEYSGETLYISSKGKSSTNAKRHYSTEKTANTDHITPVDKMKDRYEKKVQEGKITKAQLKEITNSDYNLAITSEKRNKAKGNMSNHEYLYEQLKKGKPEDFNTTFNMLQTELQSTVATGFNVRSNELNNKVNKILDIDTKRLDEISKENSKAISSGTGAAFMSFTVSTVNNIVLIATNEKSTDQAIKDIVYDTGSSFVTTTGIDLLQYALKESAKKIPNKTLNTILSKDLPIQQISAAVMIGNSVCRYLNDDITMEECVTEIFLNGMGSLAYSLGMMIGGPAGAIVSTIIIGQINKSIIEYQQQAKIDREKERRLSNLTKEALYAMEMQRQELLKMVDEQNIQFHNVVNGGFEKIFTSALQNDAEGIAVGLDNILSTVNKSVMFKSLEEYDRHFFSEEVFEF